MNVRFKCLLNKWVIAHLTTEFKDCFIRSTPWLEAWQMMSNRTFLPWCLEDEIQWIQRINIPGTWQQHHIYAGLPCNWAAGKKQSNPATVTHMFILSHTLWSAQPNNHCYVQSITTFNQLFAHIVKLGRRQMLRRQMTSFWHPSAFAFFAFFLMPWTLSRSRNTSN